MENKPQCQAYGCEGASTDDMELFCADHWAMVPADAQALIRNLYSDDYKSEQHRKWQREVRKLIAMMMAKEEGLKRNVNKRRLDDFDKEDPFVRGGEQKAAQEGRLLREPDSGAIQGDQETEGSEADPD